MMMVIMICLQCLTVFGNRCYLPVVFVKSSADIPLLVGVPLSIVLISQPLTLSHRLLRFHSQTCVFFSRCLVCIEFAHKIVFSTLRSL